MTLNHSIQVWRADGGVVNDLTEPREGKLKSLLFWGGVWGVGGGRDANQLTLQNPWEAPK